MCDSSTGQHEEELFERLNRYVEAIQAGRDTISGVPIEAFLSRHPELKPYAACLDSLERMLPPSEMMTAEKDVPANLAADSPSRSSTPERDSQSDTGRNPSSLFKQLPFDFGCYELLEEIGRGGMGVIYRARHKTLDAHVAVKLIRSSDLASQEEVRRFYQEARAAAGLAHPHIIKVHDVGEEHGLHYLAMDLIEGTDLSSLLREGPLSADRSAELLTAVARAVHYLHTRGVVHRDLKPSNILLDQLGKPFVTDFGLAKLYTQDAHATTTGTIIGTPCYMSPEQAWGRPHEVTQLSDIYSLGAILYEMLTGRPPFQEENPLDVLLRVRESEPVPPSQWNRRLPADIEQICLRCLEKEPDRRYQSAEEVAEDLDRYLKGEPINLPPASLFHRLKKWVRREPGLVSHWAALAFAATIVQGYYLLGDVAPIDHWPIMMLFACWALVSLICQKLLVHPRLEFAIPYLWSATDATFFSLTVLLASQPRELLFIGYPLLIVASGFWTRVRLVWFMTGVCLLSYLVMLALAADAEWPPHYPYLIGGILCLVGGFVAYHVHRLRVLNRYFERYR